MTRLESPLGLLVPGLGGPFVPGLGYIYFLLDSEAHLVHVTKDIFGGLVAFLHTSSAPFKGSPAIHIKGPSAAPGTPDSQAQHGLPIPDFRCLTVPGDRSCSILGAPEEPLPKDPTQLSGGRGILKFASTEEDLEGLLITPPPLINVPFRVPISQELSKKEGSLRAIGVGVLGGDP